MKSFAGKAALIFTIILFQLSCNHGKKDNGVLFRAEDLTGHPSPEHVEKVMHSKADSAFNQIILGQPIFIQLYYDKDSTECRFKDGRLVEIIVHKPKAPFSAEGIAVLGLTPVKPTSADTSAFIKWNNVYNGYPVITFYKVGIKADGRKTRYKIYLKEGSDGQ